MTSGNTTILKAMKVVKLSIVGWRVNGDALVRKWGAQFVYVFLPLDDLMNQGEKEESVR